MRPMNLSAYVAVERGRGSAVARAIGVHPVMISQWIGGVKQVPLDRCVDIERATDGAVRRWDLRPDDWHRIWPELIEVDGAPEVPAKAAA